jgi:enamine deaminase RidA (YjgF/YER057c/UK114 family)
MSERKLVSSGSPMEPVIGFSRACRVGPFLAVAGTAPIPETGGPSSNLDLYGQTRRCLEIIQNAIEQAGGHLDQVIRTRIYLTKVEGWQDAAKAHGEFFGDIRPASTFIQIAGLLDPSWLVEIEADAIIE